MSGMRNFLLAISVVCFTSGVQAGICTREYVPVCGQLLQQYKTFPNRCMMKDAGAIWISDGECQTSLLNDF
jgi:hypothetical protein